MKTLGIDFGLARIGLAVSDEGGRIAFPRAALHEKDKGQQIKRVVALIAEEGVERVVVGIPYELDGSMSTIAETAERYARKLESVVDVPVHRLDERMTSVSAERALDAMGQRYSRPKDKGKVDAVAACILLQAFLDSREA
ncbi:MAG: Holliday junction resolvase RuvX [Deltaproteobacteria bacterium]|nr:Holliday junction resolvase RuvX [Deltaproteobacteria bacterium]MCB9785169.1 Holliday junction resolvase RuvX [Deltaproteobacteria bacterium]